MDPKYKAFIYASWSWSLWAWWSQRTLSWIMILVVHGENHIDDAWICCMKVLFWSCRMSFCGELRGCSRLPMTLHTSSMWWTTEAWAVRWMSSVGITRMQEPKSFFQRYSLRNQSVLQMQLARQSVKSFEQLWGPGWSCRCISQGRLNCKAILGRQHPLCVMSSPTTPGVKCLTLQVRACVDCFHPIQNPDLYPLQC